MSGLDFQSELARANVHIPIIFITGHGDIPMTVRAMKAGAVEFLTKPFRDQELLNSVGIALERDRARREQDSTVHDVKIHFKSLTPREQEVMGFVTAGLMNKQIAAKLGVSEITVKVHRGNVMRKMGARSLADLVRMADILGIRRATTIVALNQCIVSLTIPDVEFSRGYQGRRWGTGLASSEIKTTKERRLAQNSPDFDRRRR